MWTVDNLRGCLDGGRGRVARDSGEIGRVGGGGAVSEICKQNNTQLCNHTH